MASYELEGKVKVLFETRTFPSGFTLREFVVTTQEERFPQDIKFQCVKERISLLDTLKAGDSVKVSFDIRGSENNDRYFVNLNAWRIESTGGGSSEGSDSERPPVPDESTQPVDDDDDLPF